MRTPHPARLSPLGVLSCKHPDPDVNKSLHLGLCSWEISVHTSLTINFKWLVQINSSFRHSPDSVKEYNQGGDTRMYLNTVIRWTRLTRQKLKWVDSLYLYLIRQYAYIYMLVHEKTRLRPISPLNFYDLTCLQSLTKDL